MHLHLGTVTAQRTQGGPEPEAAFHLGGSCRADVGDDADERLDGTQRHERVPRTRLDDQHPVRTDLDQLAGDDRVTLPCEITYVHAQLMTARRTEAVAKLHGRPLGTDELTELASGLVGTRGPKLRPQVVEQLVPAHGRTVGDRTLRPVPEGGLTGQLGLGCSTPTSSNDIKRHQTDPDA